MMSIILIYLCVLFSTLVNSFRGETQAEFELSNIDILEEEVKKLPIEDFIDDPELTQHIDYINKITLYKKIEKDPSGDEPAVVYERKAIDKGHMVVVLTSAEDNINVVIRKRTYVVLRQNPIASRNYFASYAYIRYSTDSNCVEWDGEPRCIEWDTWDNSRGIVKAKFKYFGWTNCASSFLASCTFNESHAEDSRDRMQPSTQKENENAEKSKSKTESPSAFLPCPGYEEDDSVDVFGDLDVDAAESQYIGKAVRYSGSEGAKALLEKGSMSAAGRSLSNNEDVDSDMNAAKEKAKLSASGKRKGKKLLKGKLLNRKKLLEQKKDIHSQLMTAAKEKHFGSWWKIKKDSKRMEKFMELEGIAELLEKLTEIEKELKHVSSKTAKDFGFDDKIEQLAILRGANEEPDAGELAEALGSSLTEVAGKTPAGRSISSDTADVMGKSVAKGLLSTTTDIFSHPGWKMQTVLNFTKEISLRHENITFFGFGGCEFSNISPTKLFDKEVELQTLINLYLQFLKTSCTPEVQDYVSYLLDKGYLEREENFLEVPQDLIQLKKQKLNATELQQLSSSFELSVFTKTFLKETKLWIYDPAASNGDQVSRSTYFIVRLGLNFIQEARRKTPLHFIKLCRNFVLTLKMAFTKLLQDYEILRSNCPKDCKLDSVINENDRNYIYGLMEFIIRGLRPVEMEENPHRIFPNFYVRNHLAVKYKANLYL